MNRSYRGKRIVDVLVLVVVGLPAAIVGGCCALAVRLSSRGPVLFTQTRIGVGDHPFTVLKFRTMVDAPDNPLIPDASRITRVGGVLRRFSLDELPQLVNVARGEMSVVGPRPALPVQVELFDADQRHRHVVRPGLTGLAQIRGRNQISWSERIEHDLVYVADQSVWLDLKIIVETPFVLLTGRGIEGHPHDDPAARVDVTT